ncbi:Rpn family recombination-promoting nuclease/putative transposase [Anabaena sphaerica FACHB-251]|uniref:Rpn family recombination-promoting nuclease/putative transposase n=1 Tax=Anabaena sphaerica FACHB-251 TaxID=2692883 RepID=A0A927A2L4_9NOST|nr:Rpn family recombination-promoting nuclease/putative transposase [Anabaena sphaerica]MBD2295386.1 Rpn family recombination-promoting nuclease/putative transposase [Anabaena sphaerica FACHB-251]
MAKPADVSTKRLISLAPNNWVKWVTNLAGLEVRQDYRVINLWEVDVKITLEQPLPSLLPFVPILKGGEDETIIREALLLLQADEQLSQLETVLAFFATFVLDSALVQEIMRWDMAVLRESPWYQEILQQGEKQGEEIGERKDRISSIELCLEVKFGDEGLKFMPKISEISDLETLKTIQRSILTVQSLEELRLVMGNL